MRIKQRIAKANYRAIRRIGMRSNAKRGNANHFFAEDSFTDISVFTGFKNAVPWSVFS